MRNFCIAIGVDGYKNPDWRLGSCVRDAIAFADWAVTSGGVASTDLRLFLSPEDLSTPSSVTLPGTNKTVSCQPASRRNIFKFVLDEMQKNDKWGTGGDRLYWYFAGHGCSHEDVRHERPEPVVFPVDVEELPIDVNNLIGFTDILTALRGCGPSRQLFFLDACRDFALPNYVSSAGAPAGRFFRPLPEADQQGWARQYVLYATAPGERAVELGCGVFSDFLIRGLSGDPGALTRLAGLGDYQLTLNRLASFVRREVEARVRKNLLGRPTRVVQIPEIDVDPGEHDFVLFEIANANVAAVDLFIRVRPPSAHETGLVQAYYEDIPVPPPCGPPLQSLNRLSLKPSYYTIEATAPGMPSVAKTVQVPFDEIVEFDLTTAPAANPAENHRLRFFTRDPNLPVQVWDSDNRPHTALGQIRFSNPKPGLYRAMVSSPEGGSIPQGYTFPACGSDVELDATLVTLNSSQVTALAQAGTSSEASVSSSEYFQNLSELKAVSLLGFAAYATYVLRSGEAPFSNFGMTPLPADYQSGTWLTVLIGAKGYEPAPGLSVAEFLNASTLEVTGADEARFERIRILPGFNTAGQILVRCPRGSFSVELRLPGVPVTRYAMVGMTGRIAVLSVTIDDDQTLEVQQYLFSFDPGELRPEDLPNLERAQRFYAAGRPIPDQIVDSLLTVKRLDPLQGCLAGYSLIRQRQHDKFVGDFVQGRTGWHPGSPLQNLMNFFDALPDTHVLAGLCQSDDRELHYKRALERGIPLFSDGFRTLIEYFSERSIEIFPLPARRALRTLSPGSLFSAWLSREPVIGISDRGFDIPPTYWRSLEPRRASIEARIAACGHLAFSMGGERQPMGSAFLVAPDIIVTTNHTIASIMAPGGPPPAIWPDRVVWFTSAIDPGKSEGVRIKEILGVDADARLALLRLEKPNRDVEPVPIAPTGFSVVPRSEIYLVGYPYFSRLSDAGLAQQVFDDKFGLKRLQPGRILAAPDTERSFDHDASTLPGNAGSPVIDLETGYAIGVHWGGMDEAGQKRGRAAALTLPANRILLSCLLSGPI